MGIDKVNMDFWIRNSVPLAEWRFSRVLWRLGGFMLGTLMCREWRRVYPYGQQGSKAKILLIKVHKLHNEKIQQETTQDRNLI